MRRHSRAVGGAAFQHLVDRQVAIVHFQNQHAQRRGVDRLGDTLGFTALRGRLPMAVFKLIFHDGVADLPAYRYRVRRLVDPGRVRGAPRLLVSGRLTFQDASGRTSRTDTGCVGYDTDGFPLFVGLGPAASESTDASDDFLADLTNQGLRGPLTQNPVTGPPTGEHPVR